MPAAESLRPRSADPFEGTAYRALRMLGRGGMGEVYVVEHKDIGREVVAKVLHQNLSASPQLAERMRVEARALGALNHPNIVSVTGFERMADGRPFIVMELLQGRTLAAELAIRGSLPVNEAAACLLEVLSALSAAHQAGLVHRDLKPENIFLSAAPTGERRVKVLDFGLALVLPEASVEPGAPTARDILIGTPHYISPEAAQGERVDARADLYAAGLVLYVMLAGRGPFDHVRGEGEVLAAHVTMSPAPPSAFAKQAIPKELDETVLRALAKRPEQRFQGAAEFAAALADLAGRFERPAGWVQTVALSRDDLAAPPALGFTTRTATLRLPGDSGATLGAAGPGVSGLTRVESPYRTPRFWLLFATTTAVTALVAGAVTRWVLGAFS